MAVKASVFQKSQLALETTAGTTVAASKRMPNLLIAAYPMFESKEYRGQGFKMPKTLVLNKEWTAFEYSGPATYGELLYILASVLSKPSAPAANVWTIASNPDTADTPATYTIQHGDATTAGQLGYGLFTDMTLKITRESVEVSGNGIGQKWSVAHALTAAPTLIESVPITANQIQVTIDSAFGSMGSTLLTSFYEIELAITGRWGPDWVLNSANSSFKDSVELVPKIALKMTLANNADSDAIITQIRAGTTQYLQIQALGALIPTTTQNYELLLSLPFQVNGGGKPKDLAGVYVCEWDLTPVDDPTAGYGINAVLANGVAAL